MAVIRMMPLLGKRSVMPWQGQYRFTAGSDPVNLRSLSSSGNDFFQLAVELPASQNKRKYMAKDIVMWRSSRFSRSSSFRTLTFGGGEPPSPPPETIHAGEPQTMQASMAPYRPSLDGPWIKLFASIIFALTFQNHSGLPVDGLRGKMRNFLVIPVYLFRWSPESINGSRYINSGGKLSSDTITSYV